MGVGRNLQKCWSDPENFFTNRKWHYSELAIFYYYWTKNMLKIIILVNQVEENCAQSASIYFMYKNFILVYTYVHKYNRILNRQIMNHWIHSVFALFYIPCALPKCRKQTVENNQIPFINTSVRCYDVQKRILWSQT